VPHIYNGFLMLNSLDVSSYTGHQCHASLGTVNVLVTVEQERLINSFIVVNYNIDRTLYIDRTHVHSDWLKTHVSSEYKT